MRKDLELKYWDIETDAYGVMSIVSKRNREVIFIQEWIFDEVLETKNLNIARKNFFNWLYGKKSLNDKEKGEIYANIVYFTSDGIFE